VAIKFVPLGVFSWLHPVVKQWALL